MHKCLVIGAAMLDIVIKIDRLPKAGEDVYAKSQEMTVGGCAYNVADILKHFQVPYTLFAPIGKGVYADIVAARLREGGHESTLFSETQDNGYCLCMVEQNGERTFLTLPGIECRFEMEWFQVLDTSEYDTVYVCGYEIEGPGGEAIIDFLENHRELQVYYAPGPRITHISREKHERIFALRPVLHLNEKEGIDYTGETAYDRAAEQLYSLTRNAVMVTLGEKGVYLYDQEGELLSSKKASVVDTIGAGDSHIGAVIAMRMRGMSLEEAVRTANKVSAMVVGVAGPTLTEEEFKKGELQG